MINPINIIQKIIKRLNFVGNQHMFETNTNKAIHIIDPKDMIQKLTVEQLCFTAENYFKSIADPTPLMAKPFTNFIETPEILQNMGLLLSGLHIGKTMTILEFAAGTCWFSRYLNQLQCKTISLDVSKTALEIGKRLFSEHPIIGSPIAEPIFLHFDGHSIDLPDESVDRIICHDGFHHVPNQDEVIAELARVLRNGGIAGFSEPGRFHSRSPQSQYEMKNYNVLENDIDITKIFEIAQNYGFDDLKIKLVCNMELTLSQYQSIIDYKIESELARQIHNNVYNVLTNKTIFFLFKGKFVPDSRSYMGLAHSICIDKDKNEFSIVSGESVQIPLIVSNTGHARWLSKNINEIGIVKIGTHLYSESGELINLDFSRHEFKKDVEPGEKLKKNIDIKFNNVGTFRLYIDLVSEGICWFENVGSKPVQITVIVS